MADDWIQSSGSEPADQTIEFEVGLPGSCSLVGRFFLDREGLLIRADSEARRMLGWQADLPAGTSWLDWMHEEDRAGLIRDWAQEAGVGRQMGRMLKADQSVIWVEYVVERCRVPDEPHVYFVVSFLDVTHRQVLEKHYRLLTENAIDMISCHAPDGTFRYVTPSCMQILGYEPQELLGRSPYDLIDPQDVDRVFAEHMEAIGDGRAHSVLMRAVRKDGEKVWLESYGKMVRDARSGDLAELVVTSRDVGARIQVEQNLRESRSELLEYQKKLQRLAAQLAEAEQQERRRIASGLHDQVGQLLALAKIGLDRLMHQAGEGVVRSQTEEISRVISEAIAVTRSLTFELCPPALYELGLEAAMESLVHQMAVRHGLVPWYREEGEKMKIDEGLRNILYQSGRELLNNVIRHADAKRVGIQLVGKEGWLHLAVEDDGCGFACQEPASSTGFGLFNIRQQMERFGGRLEIGNREEGGARVVLCVPLDGISEESEKEQA